VKKALNIDEIAYDANMGCTIVRHYLDFLIENGLAEERSEKGKTIYAITERGAMVYRILNFQKYIEKLTKSLRVMDDASQLIPIISKGTDDDKEDTEE